MDIFKQNKLLIWLIAILIILNLFSLAGIWILKTGRLLPAQQKYLPLPPYSQIPHSTFDRLESEGLITELNFNPEQIDRFKQINKKWDKDMKILMGNIHNIKKQILKEVLSSEPDTTKILNFLAGIGNSQYEIEKIIFMKQKEIKSLCTDEQKNQFDKIIKEIIETPNPFSPQ